MKPQNIFSASTRFLIRVSISASRLFDRILPAYWSVDGWTDFCHRIAPSFFMRGARVYDIGGGKNPYLSVETKRNLGITVIGVDIDADKLAAAPPGAYDATICGDISQLKGNQDGDIVISLSVLEHVSDVPAAIGAISSFLKPSGKALLFVSSRTSLYAKLNVLLPESIKRFFLKTFMPGSLARMGFKAYYYNCTPAEIAGLARDNHMVVEELHRYYFSPYFMPFFPFHVLARFRQLFLRLISSDAIVETFALVLSKDSEYVSSAHIQ